MSFYKWSKTAASNATADSTINWAEGQSPSSVNDSARAMMAAAAKFRDDMGFSGTTGGTGGAYTLSTNQVLAAWQNGFTFTFLAHATSLASATISLDGLAAKPLRIASGVALGAGDLVTGALQTATYISATDEVLIHAPPRAVAAKVATVGMVGMFPGRTPPSGWLKANGSVVSRVTYAALFAWASGVALASEATWASGYIGWFGDGDGVTTFRLPDLRGYILRPWADDKTGCLDYGRDAGTFQDQQTLSHQHYGTTGNENATHTHLYRGGVEGSAGGFWGSGTNHADQSVSSGSESNGHGHDFTTSLFGAADNRPQNISMMVCVAYI
jgi:microcystin-dependent protein